MSTPEKTPARGSDEPLEQVRAYARISRAAAAPPLALPLAAVPDAGLRLLFGKGQLEALGVPGPGAR